MLVVDLIGFVGTITGPLLHLCWCHLLSSSDHWPTYVPFSVKINNHMISWLFFFCVLCMFQSWIRSPATACEMQIISHVKLSSLSALTLLFEYSEGYAPPPHHNRFTAFFPGPPRWAGARRELMDFMVQGKINRGRHIDHPAGRHSIRTNQCPPLPSSPYFLQAGCHFCRPTNSVKALKATSTFGLPACMKSTPAMPVEGFAWKTFWDQA